MVCPCLAFYDGRDVEILSAGRASSHPAQHGNLAYVSQGVGDRTLEELLGGKAELCAGGEAAIESFESSKKPRDFLVPRQRLRLVENVLPAGELDSPIQ